MIPIGPELSQRDIEEELKFIHREKHRTMTTAMVGRGEPSVVALTLDGVRHEFRVENAVCELRFRKALLEANEKKPVVVLVDYEPFDRLPADVAGRIAGGKVYQVDRGRRLARLFGATAASSELLAARGLCEALLAKPSTFSPIRGTTVDLDTAFRALFARETGLSSDGAITADNLIAFFATTPPRPDFVAMLAKTPTLASEIVNWLSRIGPLAPMLWRAWLAGKARDVASMTFILEAAWNKFDNSYLLGQVRNALAEIHEDLRQWPVQQPVLVRRWAELAPIVERRFDSHPGPFRDVLAAADKVLQDKEVDDVVATSRLLPRAFAVLQHRLAAQLTDALGSKSTAFAVIAQTLKQLDNHVLRGANHDLVERAQMAVRLLAYVRFRTGFEAELSEQLHERFMQLAEHYVAHGAFVDTARWRARGDRIGVLEVAIDKVLEHVDALRDRDDTEFARGLQSWTKSDATDKRLIAIERALDELAVGFLKGHKHRKLLVLLLDGMAWASAVVLLESLEPHHVAPLRWPAAEKYRYRPMLAALPTITTVSRAAFFKGKRLSPGESEDTSKDPDRFASHKKLSDVNGKPPTLYLRPDVDTGTGDVSEKAIKLVRSEDRVVGLVINAIDDQLKGSKQMRVPADVKHIKPLKKILETASEVGRAVLLVADHGHVLGGRMQAVPSLEVGGKRWRALSEHESAIDGEVVLEHPAAWRPKGKPKLAMLYRETMSYGGSAHLGEHGGASLAEVIAPAILVGSDQLRRQVHHVEGEDDAELEVAPFPCPAWWLLDVKEGLPAVEVTKPPLRQLEFPIVAPPTKKPSGTHKAISPIAQPVAPSRYRKLLEKSKLLAQIEAERKTKPRAAMFDRIDILAAHGGRMSDTEFARAAQLLPHQAAGAVTEMAEWLNADTYQVAVYDRVAREVCLDLNMLESLFGD